MGFCLRVTKGGVSTRGSENKRAKLKPDVAIFLFNHKTHTEAQC